MRFAFNGVLGDVLAHHLTLDMAGAKPSNKYRVYYYLRPWIPITLRQKLQRKIRRDCPPRWYVNSTFMEDWTQALRNGQYRSEGLDTIHPWPDGHRFAVALSHDVETEDGVRLVPALAEVENRLGLRSVWNFIPYKYKVDSGLLNELVAQGHEIGVHGYNHDGKLFLNERIFERRVPKINEALRAWKAVGFRAPMVHRNLVWQQSIDVLYDASCFDIDPFQAMPGGVGGVWPFLVGDFIELPYTLPQDHTLMVVLNESTARIWLDKLQVVKDLCGMSMVITHPDYLNTPKRLKIYQELLEHLANDDEGWKATPAEIASWWSKRDKSYVERLPDGSSAIRGPAADRGQLCSLKQLFNVC
ncbi:MAG: hypothetical protein KDB03_17830 [Planctomycetales bacterium]|nr:hypothetical protein [Planctomycetales bacterium]